jgi:hypothetical protein
MAAGKQVNSLPFSALSFGRMAPLLARNTQLGGEVAEDKNVIHMLSADASSERRREGLQLAAMGPHIHTLSS